MTTTRTITMALLLGCLMTTTSCGTAPRRAPAEQPPGVASATPNPALPSAAAPPPLPAHRVTPTTVAPRGADRPGLAGSRRTTSSNAVALTFDDGPDPVNTPKLMDLLKDRAVAAIAHDLQKTNNEILRAAPGATIRYFRAPYGNFTPRLIAIAQQLGMVSLGWNLDDECYLTARFGTGTRMVARMTRRVETRVRPGTIVLSHDLSKPHTITAYRRLLPRRYQVIALPVG